MRLPDIVTTGIVSREKFNQLRECVKWLMSNAITTAGAGFEVHSLARGRGLSGGNGIADTFRAKITGSAFVDGNSKGGRYRYAWQEVTKTVAGYGGWTVPDGGKSGTTSENSAYNWCEDMNTGTSLGNGVSTVNLLGTYKMKPCPVNCIVTMEAVNVAGNVEYWFSYENGTDGECE
jgi:hypothetical protein